MGTIQNIKQVLIGANCGRTPGVQIWDPSLPDTYLGNGEIVITAPNGVVLDNTVSAADVDRIFIQQRGSINGAKNTVYRSVELPGKMITGYYCEKQKNATEQSSILGFNGVSGITSINLVANTLYYIKVIPLFTRGIRNPETFAWKSGNIIPTEADVLLGIADAINTKKSYDKLLKITASVLTNSTITAVAGTGVISEGSKVLTISGAGITTAIAGNVVKIDGNSYLIDEVKSPTEIKLSMPFQGTSVTNASIDYIEDKTDGDWGLKIDGLEYEFEAGFYNYNIAKFNLTVSSDINSKFVTTSGDRGSGTYKQVADEEWNAKNAFGNNKKVHPQIPIDYKYDVNSADVYDLITITWENTETKNIDGNTIHSGAVLIAIPVGADQGDSGSTSIIEVLNKYIVTEHGIGKPITLS